MNAHLPFTRQILLLFCLFFGTCLVAQVNDTSALQLRTFDKSSLEKYKQDSDFVYEETVASESLNIGDLIRHYLLKLFGQLFSTKQELTFYKIIFYVLMIGSLGLILLNLMGINVRGLFTNKPENAIAYSLEQENIKEMNLDNLIAESYTKKQWRICVRYQYLKTLRLLADYELINWQQGKTNMDYYYELKSPDQKSFFMNITNDFEKVWYGKQDLNEADYLQIKLIFDTFYTLIKTAKR